MNNEPLYNRPEMDALFSDFDQAEAARVEMRMMLAAKIDDAIKVKGWTKKEFAAQMGKSPSEISKWLSGLHNFTSDTLFDISEKLCIDLLNLEKQKPQHVPSKVYQIIVSVQPGIPASPFYGSSYWGSTPEHRIRRKSSASRPI